MVGSVSLQKSKRAANKRTTKAVSPDQKIKKIQRRKKVLSSSKTLLSAGLSALATEEALAFSHSVPHHHNTYGTGRKKRNFFDAKDSHNKWDDSTSSSQKEKAAIKKTARRQAVKNPQEADVKKSSSSDTSQSQTGQTDKKYHETRRALEEEQNAGSKSARSLGSKTAIATGILVPSAAAITAGILPTLNTHAPGRTNPPHNPPSNAPLTLQNLSLSAGDTSGGEEIQLTGTGFLSATTVRFGTAIAIPYELTETTCKVKTPVYPTPGPVQVTVSSSTETSNALTFTYNASTPAILKALIPASGLRKGNYDVQLSGENFKNVIAIQFAGTRIPLSVTAEKDSLSIPAPASTTLDFFDVFLINADGVESNKLKFQYVALPAASIDPPFPNTGFMEGGYWVTLPLKTLPFSEISQVQCNNKNVLFGMWNDPMHLRITMPPTSRLHQPETVSITVINAEGTPSAPQTFTYVKRESPILSRLSRESGPQEGGYPVTLNGLRLQEVTQVLLEGSSIPFIRLPTITNDVQLQITMPHQSIRNAVSITVMNFEESFSNTLIFNYTAPVPIDSDAYSSSDIVTGIGWGGMVVGAGLIGRIAYKGYKSYNKTPDQHLQEAFNAIALNINCHLCGLDLTKEIRDATNPLGEDLKGACPRCGHDYLGILRKFIEESGATDERTLKAISWWLMVLSAAWAISYFLVFVFPPAGIIAGLLTALASLLAALYALGSLYYLGKKILKFLREHEINRKILNHNKEPPFLIAATANLTQSTLDTPTETLDYLCKILEAIYLFVVPIPYAAGVAGGIATVIGLMKSHREKSGPFKPQPLALPHLDNFRLRAVVSNRKKRSTYVVDKMIQTWHINTHSADISDTPINTAQLLLKTLERIKAIHIAAIALYHTVLNAGPREMLEHSYNTLEAEISQAFSLSWDETLKIDELLILNQPPQDIDESLPTPPVKLLFNYVVAVWEFMNLHMRFRADNPDPFMLKIIRAEELNALHEKIKEILGNTAYYSRYIESTQIGNPLNATTTLQEFERIICELCVTRAELEPQILSPPIHTVLTESVLTNHSFLSSYSRKLAEIDFRLRHLEAACYPALKGTMLTNERPKLPHKIKPLLTSNTLEEKLTLLFKYPPLLFKQDAHHATLLFLCEVKTAHCYLNQAITSAQALLEAYLPYQSSFEPYHNRYWVPSKKKIECLQLQFCHDLQAAHSYTKLIKDHYQKIPSMPPFSSMRRFQHPPSAALHPSPQVIEMESLRSPLIEFKS